MFQLLGHFHRVNLLLTAGQHKKLDIKPENLHDHGLPSPYCHVRVGVPHSPGSIGTAD